MTATLPRDATGRFTARPPLQTCAKCGRVLFQWGDESWCVWERCELARQVVGHTGADAAVLAS